MGKRLSAGESAWTVRPPTLGDLSSSTFLRACGWVAAAFGVIWGLWLWKRCVVGRVGSGSTGPCIQMGGPREDGGLVNLTRPVWWTTMLKPRSWMTT